MEWLILFVIGLGTAAYFRLKSRPSYTWSGLPTITPNMIEPRGVPISRPMAAEAYRKFIARYFCVDEKADSDRWVGEFLDGLSEHIAEREMYRDETWHRAKEARTELRQAKEHYAEVSTDDEKAGWEEEVAICEETLRRRTARLDAQNAEIDSLKADAREYLVSYINARVAEFKGAAGIDT